MLNKLLTITLMKHMKRLKRYQLIYKRLMISFYEIYNFSSKQMAITDYGIKDIKFIEVVAWIEIILMIVSIIAIIVNVI